MVHPHIKEIEMSEQVEDLGSNEGPTELEILKQRATLMGVKFSNNIGVEALKQRIADHEAGLDKEEPEAPKLNPLAGDVASQAPAATKSPRQVLIEEATKLVRLRITNLDPKKKDLPGEILTIANEYIGTIRKFIPYGEVTDDGWHVPYCLYQMMKDRKFLDIRVRKDRRTGTTHTEQRWVSEYSLEVLDPLTPEELKQLAQAQLAAGSID